MKTENKVLYSFDTGDDCVMIEKKDNGYKCTEIIRGIRESYHYTDLYTAKYIAKTYIVEHFGGIGSDDKTADVCYKAEVKQEVNKITKLEEKKLEFNGNDIIPFLDNRTIRF